VNDSKWESFQFTGTATDSATWNMLSLWKEFGGAGNVKTISVNDGEASFPDSEGNANIIVPITEIDEALDAQSTNPVQNKVIKEALAQMDTRFAAGMDIDTETNTLSLLDAVSMNELKSTMSHLPELRSITLERTPPSLTELL
jgi:muconolactone delta-isomerase